MPSPRPTLTIAAAAAVIREAGFGVRPPGMGLELEWFVTRDGVAVTDIPTIRAAVTTGGAAARPGALSGGAGRHADPTSTTVKSGAATPARYPRKRSASMAAMQPVPAAVIAWR